jgi:hypothetical protein
MLTRSKICTIMAMLCPSLQRCVFSQASWCSLPPRSMTCIKRPEH